MQRFDPKSSCIKLKEWQSYRYSISNASYRKYIDFDMYPLYCNPTTGYEPEVKSMKLGNGNVVITIFMTEDDKPTAYQMLFDSLGQYVPFDKTKTLKPKNIEEISGKSDIHIKRTPASRVEAGKYKGSEVHIWGYDAIEGILHWKKYLIE
jgi:GH15 family glucan-1,4-alpha-glucosidase